MQHPFPLTRTNSSSSISSDATTGSSTSRRTRRRFTQSQLLVLEQTYHKTSHPTREQRENVAKETGMDMKAVTIWFQNKRQTDRKVALHNATNRVPASPALRATPRHMKENADLRSTPTPSSSPLSCTSRMSSTKSTRSAFTRVSLDHVASRSELPSRIRPPLTVQTTRPQAIWDHLPSSPVHSDSSPCHSPVLARNRKSLEWACAAARGTAVVDEVVAEEDTESEDEKHDAVTPNGSRVMDWSALPSGCGEMTRGLEHVPQKVPEVEPAVRFEDDVMHAALALCGLSRG